MAVKMNACGFTPKESYESACLYADQLFMGVDVPVEQEARIRAEVDEVLRVSIAEVDAGYKAADIGIEGSVEDVAEDVEGLNTRVAAAETDISDLQAADENLQLQVFGVQEDIQNEATARANGDSVNAQALQAEKQARLAAESSLSDRISTNTTSIETVDSRESGHFTSLNATDVAQDQRIGALEQAVTGGEDYINYTNRVNIWATGCTLQIATMIRAGFWRELTMGLQITGPQNKGTRQFIGSVTLDDVDRLYGEQVEKNIVMSDIGQIVTECMLQSEGGTISFVPITGAINPGDQLYWKIRYIAVENSVFA